MKFELLLFLLVTFSGIGMFIVTLYRAQEIQEVSLWVISIFFYLISTAYGFVSIGRGKIINELEEEEN